MFIVNKKATNKKPFSQKYNRILIYQNNFEINFNISPKSEIYYGSVTVVKRY